MSLNIRQDDWAGILLYWLFSHIDEMILHDPTRHYDQSVIINAKNQFCNYKYTKINGDGDFENQIKNMQITLSPCNTPNGIYKIICDWFYLGILAIIPNKGLVINSSFSGKKYIIPQKYKKKKVYIVTYNNGLDLRKKYICHLCELVHCKQWQFFNKSLCRLANDFDDSISASSFKYNDFKFDWGIFVWHKGSKLIDCPYNDEALKFVFESMRVNE